MDSIDDGKERGRRRGNFLIRFTWPQANPSSLLLCFPCFYQTNEANYLSLSQGTLTGISFEPVKVHSRRLVLGLLLLLSGQRLVSVGLIGGQ